MLINQILLLISGSTLGALINAHYTVATIADSTKHTVLTHAPSPKIDHDTSTLKKSDSKEKRMPFAGSYSFRRAFI